MKLVRWSGIAGLLLGLAALAQAQPGEALAPVTPLINQKTLSVIRVDVSAVHFDEIGKWVDQNFTGGSLGAEDKDAVLATLHDGIKAAAQWAETLVKSGGNTLWIINTQEFEEDAPPMLVVELAAGADAAAITKLFGADAPPPSTQDAQIANRKRWIQVGNLLVISSGEDASPWKNLKPEARPDLAKVFASAGPGTVQAAFIPSPALKQMFGQMDQLPDKRPMTALTDTVVSCALSLQATPQMSGKLVIQTPDAAAATNLLQIVHMLLDAGKQAIQQQHDAGAGPGLGAGPALALQLALDLTNAVHADADKLVVDIQPKHLAGLATAIGSVAVESQRMVRRFQSSSNVRLIIG